jgi:hypothetical protein
MKYFLTSILFLLVASSAWASPPERFVDYVPFDFDVLDCDGYSVWTSGWERDTYTLFFDKDGNETRLRTSIHITDAMWYNKPDDSEAPPSGIYIQQGASGTGENFQIWENFVTGEFQGAGLPYRITLPRIGPLYLEAGRTSFDGEWHITGVVIFPEDGTGSALCDALAP